MSEDWNETGNPWTVRATRKLFDNPWFAIEEHEVINPAGKDALYAVMRHRKLAVGIVPLDQDGRIHLVGQWRFPLARYSWEIPEGGAEPGEGAEATARRELAEEAGLAAGRLDRILEMDLSNSVTDETCIVFLAADLSPAEAQPDVTEILQRRTVPFRDALARALDGRIRDAMTVAGLLRVHHMAVTGELPPALAQAVLE